MQVLDHTYQYRFVIGRVYNIPNNISVREMQMNSLVTPIIKITYNNVSLKN